MTDERVPSYLSAVLNREGQPIGTAFQISPGVLVTALHVVPMAGYSATSISVATADLTDMSTPQDCSVVAVDEAADLALLRRESPLAASAVLARSDLVEVDDEVSVSGVADVRGEPALKYITAPGRWAGPARRDATQLASMRNSWTVKGLSGAPVIRSRDGAVVGVVSGRYNSADGWLRDATWVCRTEAIEAMVRSATGGDIVMAPHQARDVRQINGAIDKLYQRVLDSFAANESAIRLELPGVVERARIWEARGSLRAVLHASEIAGEVVEVANNLALERRRTWLDGDLRRLTESAAETLAVELNDIGAKPVENLPETITTKIVDHPVLGRALLGDWKPELSDSNDQLAFWVLGAYVAGVGALGITMPFALPVLAVTGGWLGSRAITGKLNPESRVKQAVSERAVQLLIDQQPALVEALGECFARARTTILVER